LRNGPHQAQCELNDAELEVVVGAMDDLAGISDAIKQEQSQNYLEQRQNLLEQQIRR
jgi:hypothetical protein